MNIWILEGDSGLIVYYKSFSDLQVNEDLVSGLLTALNQFTITEFKQPIESIDMGGLRWIYILDKQYNILFVASDTKNINAEVLRSRLNIIKQSFIDEYIDDSWRDTWHGNRSIFYSFNDILEKFYNQWTQVENILTTAEFFDILGIFQYVLNMIRTVIEDQTVGVEKDLILKKIDNIFKTFMNQHNVKSNQELSHITYSKDSGFNLLNIDPNNCDIVAVEKQIFKLIRDIVQLIKEKIGHELALVYFDRANIFTYLFNNIVFLKELNLDIFLLKLFIT